MLNEKMKSVIAALRNGKYNQSKVSLQDSDMQCYLGVLCDEKETGHKSRRNSSPEIAVVDNTNTEGLLIC
jgi:hypothetical protein